MSQGLPNTITCFQCTMTLRVERTPKDCGEKSRCSDCKRPFWHYDHNTYKEPDTPAHIRVGILPEWLPEWQA